MAIRTHARGIAISASTSRSVEAILPGLAPEQISQIKKMLADLNKNGRTLMDLSRTALRLQREFGCLTRIIVELLNFQSENVLNPYLRLRHLVPEVHPLVDRLGIHSATLISAIRPERQLEFANLAIQGLSYNSLRAAARSKDVRNPDFPPLRDE